MNPRHFKFYSWPADFRERRQPPQVPDHKLLRRIATGGYGRCGWHKTDGHLPRGEGGYRGNFSEEGRSSVIEGIQRFEPVSREHLGFVSAASRTKRQAGFFIMSWNWPMHASGDIGTLLPEEPANSSTTQSGATPRHQS